MASFNTVVVFNVIYFFDNDQFGCQESISPEYNNKNNVFSIFGNSQQQ